MSFDRDDSIAQAPGGPAARVVLRPIANPLALGFGALAATTLITAGTELGWIPASQRHEAAVLVIAFGPPLQLIGSYFGFLARDAVAATGLGIQSAAWLCIGLSLLVSEPGSHSHALALLLFSAGVGVLSSAAVAARTKLLVGLVMGLTSLRFILTGVFEWVGGTGWGNGAGWTGVVLCGLALYAAVSLELEDVTQRTILPTLRRGAAKRVLHQPLDEQIQDVATEAGVRSQL